MLNRNGFLFACFISMQLGILQAEDYSLPKNPSRNQGALIDQPPPQREGTQKNYPATPKVTPIETEKQKTPEKKTLPSKVIHKKDTQVKTHKTIIISPTGEKKEIYIREKESRPGTPSRFKATVKVQQGRSGTGGYQSSVNTQESSEESSSESSEENTEEGEEEKAEQEEQASEDNDESNQADEDHDDHDEDHGDESDQGDDDSGDSDGGSDDSSE